MSKKVSQSGSSAQTSADSKKSYKDTLRKLQVELVKLQRHFIECNDKILVILEGRDASGKDGTIKRIVQHLSPRETRVVALGKPSDRDQTSWYFQRAPTTSVWRGSISSRMCFAGFTTPARMSG